MKKFFSNILWFLLGFSLLSFFIFLSFQLFKALLFRHTFVLVLLVSGLLFFLIYILFAFWKKNRALSLGVITGLSLMIALSIFFFLGLKSIGDDMVHQNRNWEQIASEVKPMTFEQAVKNTGLDFLPKSAFNIYYYHHSYSFFGFKSIVRYEAPREVILKHVDEIIHQYPDLAPCWQEIEISANSNITKSTSVTWFNIENIKNGKKWGCSNSGGQFKGPVGGQQIFVDFDNNLLYFSAHD